MQSLLEEILNIDASRECIKFLVKRMQNDNYRGLQISQHNRYTKEVILIILQKIDAICGTELLQIRTTDSSKRPSNRDGEEEYAQLTININAELGRCTQDSLRKNIFVDLHRMGLIDRFDDNCTMLEPFVDNKGVVIKYIALTPFGREFLQSEDIQQQDLLFIIALKNLMRGFDEEIFHMIQELGSGYLTIYEILFFATFLHQVLESRSYSRRDIVLLIRDYRELSESQKQALCEKLQLYCNPENFGGDKTQKRDFHNWMNETQQILRLLAQMPYFKYNKYDSKLYICGGG
ncbi:restriction endonuclease subunit R [Helicobacter enhydrae]|uniref:restriction endonuclease subunit R n=1 Tax=Helicobacter enhydrae TaxID=222136 RepID=UPI0009FE651D|nr:restriction endonuclease subunit R [Helicobacter enhydrae]